MSPPIEIIFSLFSVSVLIVIFFIDLNQGIIPFKVILPTILITVVFFLFKDQSTFLTHMLSGIAVSLFFFLLFAATRGKGMGFGDVVYALFLGLLLGFPNSIIGLYIAFLTGAVISLILVLLKRKKLRGSTIPFGPFLVLGTFIAYIWGDLITGFIFKLL